MTGALRTAAAAFLLLTLIPLYAETSTAADPSAMSARELYGEGLYREAAERYLLEGGRNALYNSARCWHEDYIKGGEISSLDLAVEGYYRVLDMDPFRAEALRNLELARAEQEKNQSNREQKNERSSENSRAGEDQQTSAADQLKQMADRQQELADNSADKDGKSRHSDDQDLQKDLQDQTHDAAQQSRSAVQEALQEAVSEQQKALEAMERGEDGTEFQQKAADALRRASAMASEEESVRQNREDGESGESAMENREASEGLPDDLQSLLNAEQDRRNKEESPDDRIIVEKNW